MACDGHFPNNIDVSPPPSPIKTGGGTAARRLLVEFFRETAKEAAREPDASILYGNASDCEAFPDSWRTDS